MPASFSFAGVTLHVYGLLIGLAILLVLKIAEVHLGNSSQKKEYWWDAAFFMISGSLIGARLWHVITDWHLYHDNWIEAVYVWQGGLSIVGALAGVVVGAYLAARRPSAKLRFLEMTDLLVVGLPFGQALGRMGNWINQELYGLPTQLPWKIYIEAENRLPGYQQFEYYHPLFLYEMVLLLIVGATLWWLAKERAMFSVGKGLLTGLYLASYGWLRFWLEFLRIDKATIADSIFGINQIIMLFVGLGATVYVVRIINKRM